MSFLGTTNYYLKFVSRYAELRRLLRKDFPWEWSEACQAAFDQLKEALISPTTLGHFSPGAKTFVSCDASSEALGAVLSQELDGYERSIAYASRALSSAEIKYSVGEREALACIRACEHWHFFLYGRKFILRTDHRALTKLLSPSGSGHRPLRIHRWADRLCQYNYEPVYRPGKHNQAADFLSRSTPEIVDESNIDDNIHLLTAPFNRIITQDELESESGRDSVSTRLRLYTTHNQTMELNALTR